MLGMAYKFFIFSNSSDKFNIFLFSGITYIWSNNIIKGGFKPQKCLSVINSPCPVVEHFENGYTGNEYVTSVVVVDYDEGGEPSKMTG